MKFLLGLAWKNLSRHRRRTIITSAAIAVGIALFIWIDAFLLGAEKDSERNLKWYETGSAKILHKEYWEEIDHLPLKHAIDNPERVTQELDRMGVKHTSRITFSGELFFREGSLPVKLVALDPDRDSQVFYLSETVVEGGRFLEPGENEILVGQWLAEDLEAQLGDTLEIRTRTRHGSMQTLEVEIVGIISSPNPMLNKGTGFLPLSLAQFDLEMDGAVTEIAIALPDGTGMEKTLAQIESKVVSNFSELELLSWQELAKDFVAVAEMKTKGSRIYTLLIFIIAAVGISNTMLIAVYERVREIGMMRALGMQNRSIRITFLLEAAGIGLIGSLIGLVIGVLATIHIVYWGIDYSQIQGQMNVGYRITGIYRGAWNPQTIITAPILAVVISTVIALIPASRALRMKITECLRYE